MHHITKGMTRHRFYKKVNVIGHHNPFEESIPSAVEKEHDILNYTRSGRVFQMASAVSGIEPRFHFVSCLWIAFCA